MKSFKNALIVLICFTSATLFAANRPLFNQIKEDSPQYHQIRQAILTAKGRVGPKPTKEDPLNEILPGLYIGSLKALPITQKYRISHVLCCRKEFILPKDRRAIFRGMHLSDTPAQSILPYFQIAFPFINSSRTGVLVHCYKGHSRSAAVTIAYLMYKFDVPFRAALNFVQSKRPTCQPNQGFCRQLLSYEAYLKQHPHSYPKMSIPATPKKPAKAKKDKKSKKQTKKNKKKAKKKKKQLVG